MNQFQPFPKIPRLNRTVILTEKIDGTNACVHVTSDGVVYAQSRNRSITPDDDNFGFARWVAEHSQELLKLGQGYHYGEWWGLGIQRGYGLKEKRFSLFNTARWSDPLVRPACCHVVPVLGAWEGFGSVEHHIKRLKAEGSQAAPGFMQPEGLIAFHSASGQLFKVLIENDDKPKGAVGS